MAASKGSEEPTLKKIVIYTLLLAGALAYPAQDVELAKMKPVETIGVRHQNGLVVIETDTEDMGFGRTVNEAIEDLKETSAGWICMDTAKYLLIAPDAREDAFALMDILDGDVRVCGYNGEVDMREVGEYLQSHRPNVSLERLEKETEIGMLCINGGRLKIN